MDVDPTAVVQQWWDEAWGENSADAIERLVADRYTRHGATGTVHRTRAEFADDMCRYQRVLHRPVVRIDDQAVNGQKVWSRVTMRGINLETGEPRSVSWLQVHRIDDAGKIAESWVLYTADVAWVDTDSDAI